MALNLAPAAVHAAPVSATPKRRHNAASPVVATPFSTLFSQSAMGALAPAGSPEGPPHSASIKAGGTRDAQELQAKTAPGKSSRDISGADKSSHSPKPGPATARVGPQGLLAATSKDAADLTAETSAQSEQPSSRPLQPIGREHQNLSKQPAAKSAPQQANSSQSTDGKTPPEPPGVEASGTLTVKSAAPGVHPVMAGSEHASAIPSHAMHGVEAAGALMVKSAAPGVHPVVAGSEHASAIPLQGTHTSVGTRSGSVDKSTGGKISRAPGSGGTLENTGSDQASKSQAQRIMQSLDPDFSQSAQGASAPTGTPRMGAQEAPPDSASHAKTAGGSTQALSNPIPEAGGKPGEVLSVSNHKAGKASTPQSPANPADNGGMMVPTPGSSVSASSSAPAGTLLSSQNAPLWGQDSSNPNWVAPSQITANLVNAMSESLSVTVSGTGEEIKIQINGAESVISSLAEHAQDVAGSITKNISGKAGEDRSGRHSQRQPRFPT